MNNKQKYPHTLAVFTNDKLKMFHIWQTSQDNLKNVSVVNALSKAKHALSGKLSAQPAATTSFYRVILNKRKDWKAIPGYSFVKPIKSTNKFDIDN